LKTAPKSTFGDERYRTVKEADIIDSLLIAARPYEIGSIRYEVLVSQTTNALNNWVRMGLGVVTLADGQRLFDPVEVINHMKWTGVSGLDSFWSEHFVRTSRRMTQELAGRDHTIAPKAQSPPRRFSVTLRRSFDLSGIGGRANAKLRIPLPLMSYSHDIAAEAISSDRRIMRTNSSDGRFEFVVDATESPLVEVAAEVCFTTTGYSGDGSGDDLDSASTELYLRPSEGLIKVTPRVQALAHSLNIESGTWETALNLWNYLLEELSCGMVHYDQVDAAAPGDWVLDAGWYDCQLGSALLCSLCRSLGIPARLMSGYMLYEVAPGFHYWSEIWIADRGWLPFDFLSWDLSEGGRDKEWKARFAGQVEYRMVTQCFPLRFTGPMSVRFPPAWHLVNAPAKGGMKITFTNLEGNLIYSDQVAVRTLT
jgi:Transglutaminase-like superfamily